MNGKLAFRKAAIRIAPLHPNFVHDVDLRSARDSIVQSNRLTNVYLVEISSSPHPDALVEVKR